MAQVSPAINEAQNVETASWNSPIQPVDNLDITITDSSPPPIGLAEAYSVTTGDPPHELGCPEPLTSPGDPLSTDPMLASVLEGAAAVARSPNGHSKENETSPRGKKPRTCPEESLQDAIPAAQPTSSTSSPGEKRQSQSGNGESKVEVTVEGADLWHQFYQAGTEMIITRAGRRMFPGLVVCVSGLESDSKYTFAMEINPADNGRYKYLNSKWVVVGKSDSHCEEMLKYVHPDSPASGRHWMANKVSFKKIKVTNNRSNRRGHVALNSMHRYLPRLIISKHISKKNTTVVHTQEFPECCFIAVTAYQNDKVTQLKIDYNPFAKAFRDNPNESDMYGYPGMTGSWPSSPLLHYPYSPDGTGALLSPNLQPPTPSPLPQFASAFGMWESPPCTPNAYRTQGLNGGAMLSPGLPPHTPSPLPQFSTAFHMWEAPPYSTNAYRTQGPNGVAHPSVVGYAPPGFQSGNMLKLPPPHNPLVSQQLMAGSEVGLTMTKVEPFHHSISQESMDQ